MPIVVSVLLFIVYYIIDNSGYKLARDGQGAVWAEIPQQDSPTLDGFHLWG